MTRPHPANSGTRVDINAAAAVHRNARYSADHVVALRAAAASRSTLFRASNAALVRRGPSLQIARCN